MATPSAAPTRAKNSSSSGNGGVDRAALPLRPALEVDARPVPLEVARAGDDEVRPERVVAHEHRRHEDEAGALGQLGHARIVRGAVAGDDERADLAVGELGLAPSAVSRQAWATPRPFGVRGRT